jgi:DNA-binding NtrC family response regulator
MRQRQLLIIEDDTSIRALLSDWFTETGYVVRTAINGADALQKIMHAQPDVVILDLRMPIMSGFDLLAALQDHGVEVPCVIATANHKACSHITELPVDHMVYKLVADLSAHRAAAAKWVARWSPCAA